MTSFAATCVELEAITLSRLTQKTRLLHVLTYKWELNFGLHGQKNGDHRNWGLLEAGGREGARCEKLLSVPGRWDHSYPKLSITHIVQVTNLYMDSLNLKWKLGKKDLNVLFLDLHGVLIITVFFELWSHMRLSPNFILKTFRSLTCIHKIAVLLNCLPEHCGSFQGPWVQASVTLLAPW